MKVITLEQVYDVWYKSKKKNIYRFDNVLKDIMKYKYNCVYDIYEQYVLPKKFGDFVVYVRENGYTII